MWPLHSCPKEAAGNAQPSRYYLQLTLGCHVLPTAQSSTSTGASGLSRAIQVDTVADLSGGSCVRAAVRRPGKNLKTRRSLRLQFFGLTFFLTTTMRYAWGASNVEFSRSCAWKSFAMLIAGLALLGCVVLIRTGGGAEHLAARATTDGPRRCPIFVHYNSRQRGNSTDGRKMWLHSLVRLLEHVGEPHVHRASDLSVLRAPEKYIAYFSQSFRPPLPGKVRARFTGPRFYGPFVTQRVQNPQRGMDALEGSVIICENEEQEVYCANGLRRAGINASRIVSPVGISAAEWRPTRPRAERRRPLILIKRTNHEVGRKIVFHLLKHHNVSNPVILQTAHRSDEGYSQSEFKEALANAPWMLTATPQETLGFFLQEAKSMDVPLFVLSSMNRLPWFFPSDGVAVNVHSSSVVAISKRFRHFLKNVSAYRPRNTVVRHLSHEASARRLRRLTGSLFRNCTPGEAQWIS